MEKYGLKKNEPELNVNVHTTNYTFLNFGSA
jgi:hypothetical protein